ncbi:MAG: hypothetical protein WBR29_10470 [Gammaproteobacteria bacterium]
MKPWQMRLEETLRTADAPAVLSRDLLTRMARTAREGEPAPTSSLTHWLKGARITGNLAPVVQGLYLNQYRKNPVLLADAAHALVADAVISLNTVLGDSGVLNNQSRVVTAIVPIDRAAPPPKLGRRATQAGIIQFFGLPRRILEAGRPDDRLESTMQRDHVRATPEKALLDWLYLANSPRSRRTLPPKGDMDIDLLDRARLKRLAAAMELSDALSMWLKG